MWGNLVAAGVLDRYLARTGYRSQQRREPEQPGRPDNLWNPVPGDHGAHGAFDSRAREHSGELWLAEHRGLALLAAATAGVAAVTVWRARKHQIR
jgi:hypothetical protein